MAVLRTGIERALDDLMSNEGGMKFQGLAVILAKRRWPDLIASERKSDLGADAIAKPAFAAEGEGKVLACSTTATIAKVRMDANASRINLPASRNWFSQRLTRSPTNAPKNGPPRSQGLRIRSRDHGTGGLHHLPDGPAQCCVASTAPWVGRSGRAGYSGSAGQSPRGSGRGRRRLDKAHGSPFAGKTARSTARTKRQRYEPGRGSRCYRKNPERKRPGRS